MTSTEAPHAAPSRFESLQALRGTASILVMMHIIGQAAEMGNNAFAIWLMQIVVNIAHAGVDVFFIISGVVVATLLRQPQARPGPATLRFAFRRAARLLPLFWLTLAALMVVQALLGLPTGFEGLMAHPLRIFLISFGTEHPVAWTLPFEMHFYIVACVAMLFGRRAPAALLVWCVIHVALSFSGITKPFVPWAVPIGLELILGLAVGFLHSRVRLPRPRVLIIAAVATVIGTSLLLNPVEVAKPHGFLRVFAWGLPAMVVVWASLSWEAAGARPPRALAFLGDISYSVYLWHWVVMVAVTPLFMPWAASLVGILAFIATAVTLSIGISVLTFRYFETPINAWAGRVSKPWLNIGLPAAARPRAVPAE